MRQTNNLLVYILTVVQIIISFALGIFGNQLSDLIKIPPQLLLFGTVASVLVLLIVTILLLNHQQNTANSFPQSGIINGGKILTSKIVTAYPFAVLLGALTMATLIFVIPKIYVVEIPIVNWAALNYELVGAVIGIMTIIYFKALRHDLVLMLAYCVGLATGFSGSASVLIEPSAFYYHSTYTFIGWNMVLVTFGIIIKSARIRSYFQTALDNLTKEKV